MNIPSYIAKVMDISTECDILEWWKCNKEALPHWFSAVMKALVVQPSTAAAKRAFSILTASFVDQQERSLEDYIEASVILQFNKSIT